MGCEMKKALVLILALTIVSIVTWALCGYYLSELLFAIVPGMTHEQYTNYWFYLFVSIEIIVLFLVSFFIIKWKK